jgi:hypothetical protein
LSDEKAESHTFLYGRRGAELLILDVSRDLGPGCAD